jgi:hypothetical protein
MAGLDPAIHVFVSEKESKDVDHRDKPGDDAVRQDHSVGVRQRRTFTIFPSRMA